jgi:4-diphosphocytidyl-2-C-methyl-D-erythritol kinase
MRTIGELQGKLITSNPGNFSRIFYFIEMIFFPNAKINIGLNVVRKRADGYHDLETLFFPIGIKDALEFVENNSDHVNLSTSGIVVDLPAEQNIVVKAYRLLANQFNLPGIDIHLHKVIPFGAGLGGGSSDAAFMLKALNKYFDLKLPNQNLKAFALQLGADCSFFIENKPAFATGIGDQLEPVHINLSGYHLLLVKPPFGVGTKEAYSKVIPSIPANDLKSILNLDIAQWMGRVKNDFEPTVFELYPQIENIKKSMLESGALYAAMSGSGSSVFGIFREEPEVDSRLFPEDTFVWKEML